ncbi:MAG: response regulator [Candidatus Acidiferrales bacterium]
MPIEVLLADDTDFVRKAIRRLLESDPEIQLVAEATTLHQVIDIAGKLRPHVIAMDLHMDRHATTTPLRLKSSIGISPLVAISIWTDDEAKALADSLGAVALLDKVNLVVELIPTIKRYSHVHGQTASAEQAAQLEWRENKSRSAVPFPQPRANHGPFGPSR